MTRLLRALVALLPLALSPQAAIGGETIYNLGKLEMTGQAEPPLAYDLGTRRQLQCQGGALRQQPDGLLRMRG